MSADLLLFSCIFCGMAAAAGVGFLFGKASGMRRGRQLAAEVYRDLLEGYRGPTPKRGKNRDEHGN